MYSQLFLAYLYGSILALVAMDQRGTQIIKLPTYTPIVIPCALKLPRLELWNQTFQGWNDPSKGSKVRYTFNSMLTN